VKSGTGPFASFLRVHTKEQFADAWAFRDRKLLRDYLDSKLTELDLLNLASGTKGAEPFVE
jgi:hypothetical protein